MPYLQLDVNDQYPLDTKKTLARKMASTYADLMNVDIRRISVAIREVGQGGVWRTVEGELVPVSVLMCDIRRGRTSELRMQVAEALCAVCIDILKIRHDHLNVEFTQHAGDEMYHPSLGGFSPEWSQEGG